MKRFFKIASKILVILIVSLLLLSFIFSFSNVQSSLAKRITESVNNKYNTNLNIDKIDLSYIGNVKIRDILIRDSQQDTIIYINKTKTSLLQFKNILKGKFVLSNVYLSDVAVFIKTYKGEDEDELTKFKNKISKRKNKKSQFLLTSKKVVLDNAKFEVINENKRLKPIVRYKKIAATIKSFKIDGTKVFANIRDLKFVDINGMEVKKMNTDFNYSKIHMNLLNTHLQTKTSDLEGDIKMTYEEGDLSDFVNKVYIEANLPRADISMLDLKKYYKELGTKDNLHLSTILKGTLNDFTTQNLHVSSDQKSRFDGTIHFMNIFNAKKDFKLSAKIDRLDSDYFHLKNLLPNILGKKLPESFKEFGQFSVSGKSNISSDLINIDIKVNSEIGEIESDLIIKNIDEINQASYEGVISLREIKLGELLGDPLIGLFSMDADVVGKGFTLEHLNTEVSGQVLKHQYKGYTYQNISVHGNVKNKLFSGKIKANDPNIKFVFNGLADLSQEKYKFDFDSHVYYAEFNKLNLLKRDSISILKGEMKMAMVGNRLENMVGTIGFTNATYTNQIQDYHFKDFNITSMVKDSIQTLKINSTDIVNGQIKGKFIYKELKNLAFNAFGSIYTNYKPYEVSAKQYLDFRFKIFNHVVAVFFPEVKLGTQTSIRGEINSDEKLFKLTFKSPEVLAYDNYIEKIRLQVDNQNPIFNTQLSADKIDTRFYDISDLQLVNMTLNDTLHFRTEFNGGDSLKDKYNLAFYHTIDTENRSILGFQRSNISFNNSDWLLNPDNDSRNKIIYNNITNITHYQDFLLASQGQEILFYGDQQGISHQNFNIDLDRINLSEITPDINNFDFKGLINGGVWIEKRNNMLIPTADFQIIDLYVNDKFQGDLIGEVKGTKSNKEYLLDLYLEKEDYNHIEAKGNIDFKDKKPTIEVGISFDNYQIDILNAIGKGVIQDIRGDITGKANLKGLLKNPDLSGLLSLNNSGIFFPYINIDYALENNTKINLDNQSFTISDAKIFDTLFETSGLLSGSISHRLFKKWYLDLQVNTDNLLAINTPEEENSLFYGTGFLKGIATFKGATNNVNIAINGSSNAGTEIIVPMSDIQTIETSRFIHFKKTESEEDPSTSNLMSELQQQFNGVTMDFNLGITKAATIEIVIDKSTGSSLKGNGTGNIQMDIDTKGKYNMYGDYVVDKGFYNFKYGGLINKPFIVKRGGNISFTGDPYKAELDIEAIYKTRANPKVILPEYESNRSIPVEIETKITGELFNSKQEFDISIPNASLDLIAELDFILNEQDTGNMMRQVVSLLAIGNFFNEDNLTYTGSSIGNEVGTSVATAISNALLDIFSDTNDKIQFGFDYKQGSSDAILETENQLGVTVATRLGKNEKIIINGDVNVPTGSQSNANIAGNVSVELPLNNKETLRMKVFNRQNEIQYDDEVQGYTQGMGLSWQINFDGKPKKNSKNSDQDSIFIKQLNNYRFPKKTKKE